MTLAVNNPPQADGSKDGALAPWRLRFMRSMAARANPDRARALLAEFDARLGATLAIGLPSGGAVDGYTVTINPAIATPSHPLNDPAPC